MNLDRRTLLHLLGALPAGALLHRYAAAQAAPAPAPATTLPPPLPVAPTAAPALPLLGLAGRAERWPVRRIEQRPRTVIDVTAYDDPSPVFYAEPTHLVVTLAGYPEQGDVADLMAEPEQRNYTLFFDTGERLHFTAVVMAVQTTRDTTTVEYRIIQLMMDERSEL